jgi:hypothetical protein
MAYKEFTAGQEALAADVNSLYMQQVVARFPTAAARTAGIASPVVNQLSMTDDRAGVIQRWNGSAWYDLSPVLLAYTESAVAQGGIAATPVDVNGLITGSVTLPAGRRIRMEAYCAFVKTGAETQGTLFLRVQDGGLTLQQTALQTCMPNSNIGIYVSKVGTLAAGSHAFKCMTWCDSTSASCQVAVNRWIQVTDLGAV